MGKRRLITTDDDDDDTDLQFKGDPSPPDGKKRKRGAAEDPAAEEGKSENGEGAEEEEEEAVPPLPIGEVCKNTGKGRGRKKHFKAFEYDGNQFELEDPVLLTPEGEGQKPYVAIIKDITQGTDGSMSVTGQWFYRPEEAEKKGGGHWECSDSRQLFYSFHRDDVPAESVMHKCVVHFVPLHKQFPIRSQHPGFIVQKVYDTVERRLWKLTDKDYEDNKQHEINLLVQKTRELIGELPDLEPEEVSGDQEDQLKNKRNLRKKNVPPIDISRDDDGINKTEQLMNAETPGSCSVEASEFVAILTSYKALTREVTRDKWLVKILEAMKTACLGSYEAEDGEKGGNHNAAQKIGDVSKIANIEEKLKGDANIRWPDSAVSAATALEKACNEVLGSDFHKYNQKMRQLWFNVGKNVLLARRLLSKELEASVVLKMSPNELKDGLTDGERSQKAPEEQESIQMTDAICKRCTERKVRVADIIQAGGAADRYGLECIACGNSWYSFRDAISPLTIDAPKAAKTVGTAPLATSKFEAVEKNLVSPRDSDKPHGDIFQKGAAAGQKPVLEAQRSFSKSKTDALETIPEK